MEADMKQEIRYAIDTYGYLISIFQEVSGEQFSQMIANTYDCKDARNKYFCNIVKENILWIRREPTIFHYTIATNKLNKYYMKSKTIKEIAVWLKDRIDAGQHEENGSMDYTNFGRIKVIIQKEEGEYLIWMNDSALPDFSVTGQSTLKEIEKAIAECAMTWLSE